jgi:hypothetical protein
MAHAAVGMSSWRSLACDLSGGGVQLSLLARGNVWHLSYRLGESCVLNRGRFTCSVLQASAEFHLLPLSTVQGKTCKTQDFSPRRSLFHGPVSSVRQVNVSVVEDGVTRKRHGLGS